MVPEGFIRLLREGMESNPVALKHLAKEAIRELEREVILETLRENKWNRRKTAAALKISYRALIYKIREAGLASRHAGIRRGDPSEKLNLTRDASV